MTQTEKNTDLIDIKILDHGHVQLIDYMGSDLS